MFKRLTIPPGINREATQYSAGSSWYDCDNIRFRGGVVETIGGWKRDGTYTLKGLARESFSYRDDSGNN